MKEKKPCKRCQFGEKQGERDFMCAYSRITGKTRTAQVYKLLGIRSATRESDALLRGKHCPFFAEGKRRREPVQGICLKGTPKTRTKTPPRELPPLQTITLPPLPEEAPPKPKPKPPKKERQKQPGKLPQYDWERARTLLQEGASIAQIARALGCSEGAVSHWKSRSGLTNPGVYDFDYDGEGAKLWEAGLPIREIAAALGCSTSAVTDWCRRTGRRRIRSAKAAPPS